MACRVLVVSVMGCEWVAAVNAVSLQAVVISAAMKTRLISRRIFRLGFRLFLGKYFCRRQLIYQTCFVVIQLISVLIIATLRMFGGRNRHIVDGVILLSEVARAPQKLRCEPRNSGCPCGSASQLGEFARHAEYRNCFSVSGWSKYPLTKTCSALVRTMALASVICLGGLAN